MLQTLTLHRTPITNASFERSENKSVVIRHGQPHGKPPVPSESLLEGCKTVEISHNGSLYVLQATKLGKLILTK
jgi:hemin uptake protein HemP